MTNTELIKIREEKSLTKSEFAKLLGITPMLEGRYDGGKVVIPEAVAKKAEELAAPPKKTRKKATKLATPVEEIMPAPEVKITPEAPAKKRGRKKKDTVSTPEEVKEAVKAEMSRLVDEFNKTSAEKYEVESIEVEVEGDAEPVAKEDVIAAVGKAFEEQMAGKKGRKAKKAAEVKAPAKKATGKKTAAPQIIIESLLGGTITSEEVLSRVPKGVDKIYIKPEENKAYWVKGKKTGSVELW